MIKRLLHPAPLWRAASVVRKWSNVNYFCNLNSCGVNGTDSRFATSTWAFNEYFYLPNSQVECGFCAIGCCCLGSIWGVLFGTLEALFTSRRPRDNLSGAIGNGYNNIVERRMDMSLSYWLNFNDLFLNCSWFLSHNVSTIWLLSSCWQRFFSFLCEFSHYSWCFVPSRVVPSDDECLCSIRYPSGA